MRDLPLEGRYRRSSRNSALKWTGWLYQSLLAAFKRFKDVMVVYDRTSFASAKGARLTIYCFSFIVDIISELMDMNSLQQVGLLRKSGNVARVKQDQVFILKRRAFKDINFTHWLSDGSLVLLLFQEALHKTGKLPSSVYIHDRTSFVSYFHA